MSKFTDCEDDAPTTKKIDILQSTIGDFGKWQLRISILMALLKFPIAWIQLSIVFLAPPTQFWCKSNLNTTSINAPSIIEEMYKNVTMEREGLNMGFCQMHADGRNIPCNEYEYNRTIFRSSIVTEWNLVCGNKRFIDLTQISLMLGVLIGNLMFGVFADRKGRKRTLIICIFLQSIFGMITAWIPWYWGFVVARFFLAVANGGTTVISFVMCMEIVGGKYRTIVPILYQIPFGFGTTIMSAFAYFLRDWRDLQLALSLMSTFYIFYYWLVPESPRWLLAVGKRDEALKVLYKAAKFNEVDSDQLQVVATEFSNNPKTERVETHLFKSPEVRKRTILLCINWLIMGITFYAFSQYLGKVSKNLHFTVGTSGFISLPGTLFCVYVTTRVGRRHTISFSHFLTGVCFLAILLVPANSFIYDWPRVLFAAIGIIGLSVSMPALYLFTGELFPTVLRNAGVGVALMCTRLGSMVAPLVIALQDVSPYLPLSILGALAFIDALLILPLPETRGKALPDTIKDIEMKEIRMQEAFEENVIDEDIKNIKVY